MREGQLIALGDKGNLFVFNKVMNGVEIIPLRDKKGKILEGKKNKDAESLALGPKGEILIGFERDHRVVPYDLSGRVLSKKLDLPKDVLNLPKNSGLEAIETLNDGRLVLIGEGKDDAPSTELWLRTKKGNWVEKKLPLVDGFRPTGLAFVAARKYPILLERFYKPLQGVRIRLSWLDVDQAERKGVIAEFSSPPQAIDNMEGIASYTNAAGQDILLIISDDNFNPLQRTLLMTVRLK